MVGARNNNALELDSLQNHPKQTGCLKLRGAVSMWVCEPVGMCGCGRVCTCACGLVCLWGHGYVGQARVHVCLLDCVHVCMWVCCPVSLYACGLVACALAGFWAWASRPACLWGGGHECLCACGCVLVHLGLWACGPVGVGLCTCGSVCLWVFISKTRQRSLKKLKPKFSPKCFFFAISLNSQNFKSICCEILLESQIFFHKFSFSELKIDVRLNISPQGSEFES